ncbi:hypothetical protein GCM10007973_28560 [Polymorphobacter multimanifer]|uniref:Murein DD-endopeptidase MepM/ murein hydrolase activator NlpD n=1 Tax=Polymorphobacter multimanifer TaxID=1070431 RepID=A0A841L3D5_9SPHN|nr:M23 family metallopeptidase [Polymorphobacter multimanifer]MBB6226930.1 murein DD-endopeptidase MepM/ murein hydrolase activator NlpD [Polymorphobacter multimanifer]GGI90557.1 hypothetical protein GCM10007973_28560 [Polymorphobacter multimanifer]
MRTYVVRPGDTGIAIARDQGVRWTDVVTLNRLEPPYLLRVGDWLQLPARSATLASRPPRRTTPARPANARRSTATPSTPTSIEARARAFSLDVETLITGTEPAGRAGPATPRSSAATPRPVAGAPAFRWPVDGRLLAGFGPKPAGRFNDGINLKAGAGSPVRAAADGTVAYAGDAITGFGNLVLIRHEGGWVTAYGHNEALLVQRGTSVKAGEPIARVGSTGAVAEPQLHFEIRNGRTAIDPLRLLPPR